MVLNKNDVKRLIIYFIYDKDGIVDDYIIYMLNALRQNASEIVAVVNGTLENKSKDKLLSITNNVIERENKGFDVWAYKTAIDQYGWEKLVKFDEMIMMNFTIMGPVYPLNEMFECMDAKDLDFWGVTKFHKYENGDPFGTIKVGYIPEHIQSHFIAVRNSMIKSKQFQNYWNKMGEINDYRDAVGKHEAMFTKRFSEMGFKWDVYADMGEEYNNHPILCATREMIEKKRCPFFKRRSFMQSYDNIISDTFGQSALEAYNYIDQNTDYDVDMIWQNILRLENQADIKKNMQLNYILSSKSSNIDAEIIKARKIALVMHCYFEDLTEYCLHYASMMPESADIYITVPCEKNKEIVEQAFKQLNNNVQVIVIQNRGRDVSALLVATKKFIMNYDYVCFMHDKKVTQLKPETIGYGFSYKCFENMLGSKNVVLNAIETFEENPRLGMLMPPPPNHGDYYITLGLEWGMNFENTKNLAKELGITVPIDEKKEPIAPLGTMFWFRPRAMKLLFDRDWEYEDFPPEPNAIDGTLLHAIERIYSYVVQQEGYYPAWALSDKCADIEITNLNYMLRTMNNVVFHEGPGAGKFEDVINGLHSEFGYGNCGNALEAGLKNSSLYLNNDGVYNEKYKVDASNKSKDNDKFEYEFDIKKMDNAIREIRWDPGENANVTINDVVVTVTCENDIEKKYSIEDVTTNGIDLGNHIVFVIPDPQVIISLGGKYHVSKVTIEGHGVRRISDLDNHKISRRSRTVFQKITRVCNKLKNKL